MAGGPEISYETESQKIYHELDYIFCGESEETFYQFIHTLFSQNKLPEQKIVQAKIPDIKKIKLPYELYTDEDIRHRTIYVEASRGCPYKCEYCLSSLDVSVRSFDLDLFLREIQTLIDRGARQFKFVDRTFNLSPKTSLTILNFFLERSSLDLFLHFEMVPDRLPEELKRVIEKFPPGALQFEVGVQTWNPKVAANVSRRQNYQLIQENFKFLKEKTGVHSHADLIFGLPGETLESFKEGFNQLAQLEPDEIQVGRLKRLKGTPITKKSEIFEMHYKMHAPFEIIKTSTMSEQDIEQLQIFADFWNLVANSGRYKCFMECFKKTQDLFGDFEKMCGFLFLRFQRTHSIHLVDLDRGVEEFIKSSDEDQKAARLMALAQDIARRSKKNKSRENQHLPQRQRAHLL